MTATKKGDKKPSKDDEESGKDHGGQEPPRGPGNPNADPAKIHRDFVERRLAGGAPATPEAYARALEQWRKLPGAVATPPTEIKSDEAERPPKEGEGAESGNAGKDPKRGA